MQRPTLSQLLPLSLQCRRSSTRPPLRPVGRQQHSGRQHWGSVLLSLPLSVSRLRAYFLSELPSVDGQHWGSVLLSLPLSVSGLRAYFLSELPSVDGQHWGSVLLSLPLSVSGLRAYFLSELPCLYGPWAYFLSGHACTTTDMYGLRAYFLSGHACMTTDSCWLNAPACLLR